MSVKIIARPNVLNHDAYRCDIEAGCSLDELFGECHEYVHLRVGDHYVPKEWWKFIRPKDNSTIYVDAVPGDNQVLRGILLIAVAAAAAATGNFAASAAGLSGASAAFTSAAVAASLTIAGTLAVNALVPLPKPDDPFSPSNNRANSITGTRNTVNPFGVIPKAYGSPRFFPVLAANPFTEISGDDQYIRMLMCLGYGPLKIGSTTVGAGDSAITSLAGDILRFSETGINDYSDIELEIGPFSSITLVKEDVQEDDVGVQFPVAPGPSGTIANGQQEVRTTAPNTTEISLDLVFPTGLFSVGGDGKINNPALTGGINAEYVEWRIEYKDVADTLYTIQETFRVAAGKEDPFRINKRWKVPAGQYDVRVTRVEDDLDDRETVSYDAVWTVIRSFSNNTPAWAGDDNVIFLAMRVRATDQFSGVIDRFNIRAQAVLPQWNGSTFTEAATNNPAWAALDVLRGPQNDRPIPDSAIDLDKFLEWANFCDTHGLRFSDVRDADETILQRFETIAAAGLASPSRSDGLVSVVYEDTTPDVANLITPKNSFDFSVDRSYLKLPHAVRIAYTDPVSFQQVTRTVYRDGFSSANATSFEDIQLAGIDSADLAYFHGNYFFNQALLRPERYTVKQDWEWLRAQRGDLVKLSHDVILVGLVPGRVLTVQTNVDGDVTSVTVDEPVTMVTGTNYGVEFRKEDGTFVTVGVTNTNNTTTTLTLSTAVPNINPGDLFQFGESGKENIDLKVIKITPADGFTAELTMLDAALADILNIGTAPAFDPGITLPPQREFGEVVQPNPPVLETPNSGENTVIRGDDGTKIARVIVPFRLNVGRIGIDAVEVQWRISGTTLPFQSIRVAANKGFAEIVGPEGGLTLDIRALSISADDVSSLPTAVITHTVVGPSRPPADVTSLVTEARPGEAVVRWIDPVEDDLLGTEVWVSLTNDRATASRVAFTLTEEWPIKLGGKRTAYVWLRPVDRSLNEGNYTPAGATAGFQINSLGIIGAGELSNVDPEGDITRTIIGSKIVTGTETVGLNFTDTHLGYFDGAVWQAFIQDDGQFAFNGDASNFIAWNGATLTVQGSIVIQGGSSGVANLSDAGALATADQADFASQVTGAEKPENNADVTALRLGTALVNGSFETGDAEGWTLGSAGTAVVNDAANAHDGNYVLRQEEATGGPDTFSVYIPATQGDRFLIEAWLKRDESSLPSSSAGIGWREYDSGKGQISTANARAASAPDSVAGYQRLRAVVEIVEASAEFFRIDLSTGEGPGGHWFFDQVRYAPIPKDADISIAGTSGAGALATADTADFATQVTGAEKPEPNADVTQAQFGNPVADIDEGTSRANTGLNVNGQVQRAVRGSDFVGGAQATGLNLTATHLGYYDGATWRVFITNSGSFRFEGDASHYIDWNGTNLEMRGRLIAGNPIAQRVEFDDAVGEMEFFGNRGDGAIEKLATIGISSLGGDIVIGGFGTTSSTRIAAKMIAARSGAASVAQNYLNQSGSTALACAAVTQYQLQLSKTFTSGLVDKTGYLGVNLSGHLEYSITGSGSGELLSGGAKSLAVPGYVKFPNGLIVQWGKRASLGGAAVNVTLPISFSSVSSYVVMVTENRSQSLTTPSTVPQTASTFQLDHNGAAGNLIDYSWFAIGF